MLLLCSSKSTGRSEINLYSRVDFQEVIVAILVHHELHGASIAVANMTGQLESIPVQGLAYRDFFF